MDFEQIIIYLTTKQALVIYLIIMGGCFVENIFPPYPSDTVFLAGVFLAGRGNVGYVLVIGSAIVGGFLGAMVLYYFGRSKGRSFFNFERSYFKKENMLKIERLFKKWGSAILLISRFMAGVRSAVAITAGVGNVPVARMSIFSLISFCLWFGALAGGMYLLKSNWQELISIIKSYNILLVIVSGVVIIIWLILAYRKNGKTK